MNPDISINFPDYFRVECKLEDLMDPDKILDIVEAYIKFKDESEIEGYDNSASPINLRVWEAPEGDPH